MTATQPLPEDSLKRTCFGIVPRFADLFSGARIASMRYSNRQHGTAYDYEDPEIFLSTLGAPSLGICATPPNGCLVVTPVCDPRCGPFTLEIIEWKRHGHFLVVARHKSYIGSTWLGFVPMTESFNVEAS